MCAARDWPSKSVDSGKGSDTRTRCGPGDGAATVKVASTWSGCAGHWVQAAIAGSAIAVAGVQTQSRASETQECSNERVMACLELTDGGTAPTDLVADEPASLKLLMDGKPAADVEVTVVPADQRFQSELPEQKIKTGADGVFKVTWPRAGYYWINATANAAGTIPNATRRASYTATLEVQKP